MFNVGAADQYITLQHLVLIMRWYEEQDTVTPGNHMVSGIKRVTDSAYEYLFHLTDAGSGYTQRFRIEGKTVVNMGRAGSWRH